MSTISMREQSVVETVRACKAAGRKDLVASLRTGALTLAEVQGRITELAAKVLHSRGFTQRVVKGE